MEVSSPLGEAKSPGDTSMDTSTAVNSPEGMAYSLFQEQDMEMGEPSNQGQLPVTVKQEEQPTTVEQTQVQPVVQMVQNNTPVQPQSFLQPEQKSVPEVNMGGISLNCGMDNNQAVQNLLSQLLNPLAQQGANGPQIIQAPDGTLQIINTNGAILPNLPPSTNNITITSDTTTAPATTPIVLQHTAGTTQPVLLNPNTILLNPGTTVSPQTIIFNPFPVQNPPNNQAPGNNTTFLVAPANLTSGNTTILTNLNAAQIQTAVDANSGNNNPTVLLAPTNLGDSNTILLQPGTNTNVPATTTSLVTTGFGDAKPSTSLTRRSSGKTASQKTVQELLLEDEKKRVQVESNSLRQDLEKNRDALALRLKLRRPRNELVNQGIIPSTAFKSSPAFHEQLQRLERAKVGDHLQKKMRMRPDKAHLVHQHILEDTNLDPLVNATQQMLKRARLEQDLDIKIKNRPGPLELIEDNILKPEGEVEQIVKDGGFKFLKAAVPGSDSPFTFYDNPDGSDDALSPPQPDTSTSDTQPSSVTSIPSPSDSLFFSDKLKPFHSNSALTSPNKAVSTTLSNIAIKQEQGVTSPPAGGTSPFSVLSSSQSSSSSKNSNRNQRKKQAKRSKPKEIKFHEYKPPNEQGSKAGSQPTLGNPYNLLLMQQQLYLQLQLLQQQQQQQRIMPEQSSLPPSSNSNTVVTASTTKLPSPTVQTVSVESSPSQSDTKPVSNNSSSTSTGTTTATSTTMTKTFSISNLEDMKVSELKAELKNRGLHVSGTKPQLVQRLRLAEMKEGVGSVASSPDVTSSSTTKVSSTTDVHTDSMSECNSNRQSLASPPISPEAKTTEPMSPSSPQFEPPTFQPIKTPSVSSPVSNPSSVPFQSQPPSQEQKKLEEMVMSPTTTSSASFPLKSPPPSVASTIGDSGSTSTEMVDLSDFRMHDAQLSSELLKKQQKKIEELQRALELSQMQLYRQQIGGSGMYNAPPPPPPPPPPPQNQLLANRMHTSPPVTSDIQQFYPDLKLSSPPTTKPTTFQGQDFAHTINQHPKVFSFASPPANGQPFQFTKSHPDLRAVHQANGIVTPRSSSLPSSPTEEAILELGSGLARSITTPNFMNPPPNYEEAVRQTNERKQAQMMGSPPPVQGTSSSAPTTARSPVNSSNLSFDDLLEVLVGHGYPASGNIKKDREEENVHGSSPMNSPPPVSTAVSGPCTATTSFQRSLHEPVPSPGDLPMEVDHHDLSSLNHIMTDKSKARYSIPSMQIDSTDPENSLLSLTLESGSPAENAFPGALSGDNDLNWLDLVLPTSSGSHSVGSNADNSMSTSFGKDPFALSLADLQDVNPATEFHHLDSDVWDNIQVTD